MKVEKARETVSVSDLSPGDTFIDPVGDVCMVVKVNEPAFDEGAWAVVLVAGAEDWKEDEGLVYEVDYDYVETVRAKLVLV